MFSLDKIREIFNYNYKQDLPCKNCICLPVCKQKNINRMLSQCELLYQHWRIHSIIPVRENVFSKKKEILINCLIEATKLSKMMNRIFIPHVTRLALQNYTYYIYELGEDYLTASFIKPWDTIRLFSVNGIDIYKYKPIGPAIKKYHVERDYDL